MDMQDSNWIKTYPLAMQFNDSSMANTLNPDTCYLFYIIVIYVIVFLNACISVST